MAFYRDLADVLRAGGHHVVEIPGWAVRTTDGHPSGFSLNGWVVHHTGPYGSVPGIIASLRDGRLDLDGPLAQLGYDPHTRIWYVVAAGRANHNGFGFYVPWCPWGNNAAGIEVFNSGSEPVPQDGYEELANGLVTLTRHYHVFGIAGHKETDPNRKWDPGTIDMDKLRRDVALGGYTDDMPTPAELKVAVTDPIVAAIKEASVADRQDRGSRAYRINNTLKAILAELVDDDARLDRIVAAIEADVNANQPTPDA